MASLFFGQAGLANEAGESRTTALRLVEEAVQAGTREGEQHLPASWQYDEVTVEAPARIDLGGGWSDTPPFCLDWGGTVLNVAVQLNHSCPIQTSIRRIAEPIVRCIAAEDRAIAEYRTCDEALSSRPARVTSLQFRERRCEWRACCSANTRWRISCAALAEV